MSADDLELLKLAAKAAGIDVHRGDGWQSEMLFRALPRPNSPLVTNIEWNPLADDGDALRLAVALRIDLEWRSDGRVAAYRHAFASGHCHTACESSREDRSAATRRAIVRAAAVLGESMP